MMLKFKQDKYDVAIVGVGIGANYGSVLTYYSLYKTIESFNNKVLMVSKIGASANDPEIKNTHAVNFAKKHYNLSKIYSQENVNELNDISDTFVIGSDQVWNYGISQHFAKSFYLDFADEKKRKISYAASFGHAKDFAPSEEVPKISALMRRFNGISVREDSGVTIARDVYHVPATQVAEPIFLSDIKLYLDLASISTREMSEPYVLAYILDPTPEKKAAIEHIAKKKNLKIRIILDAWPHLVEENKKKMDIVGAVEDGVDTYDFLKLYANCSYVVTDSFHGTAFALKFEKPFASIGNKRRGVVRFDSMFRLIGHRERFTHDPEDIIKRDADFLAPLDYTDIRAALDAHVNASKQWLKAALKKPARETIGASADSSSLTPKSNYTHAAKVFEKTTALIKRQLHKRNLHIKAPTFTANTDAWQTEPLGRSTRLRIASSDASVRGNLIWTDLSTPLRTHTAYEMKIEWVLRTASQSVNVHIRNPETGKFLVVGTIMADKEPNTARIDKVRFLVPSGGFSQIMFGAIHFTGIDAGADISSIKLESIPLEAIANVATAPTPKQKRDAATVVRELSRVDDDRFINSYAQHRISRSVANARSLLMFYSHGFEKGLSRTGNFRPGFGQDSMPPLATEMNKWLKRGRNPQDSFFQIAASVVHNYFERHQAIDVDVSHFWKLFDAPVQEQIKKANKELGGSIAADKVREMADIDHVERNFVDVVFSRRSVREFTTAPVANEDIQRAVRIAMQAPSVCNRQPVRIHQFEDPATLKAVLDLQGGFRGYKMPPKLLLVTSDLSVFVGAVERNQAFIDGGLFMMLLLLGFEQIGLGSCSLNTAMNSERESAIREILKIPESEVFISFVAVGHFAPDVVIPRSKRLPLEEVLVRHADRLTN